jgi:glucokinase
MHAVSGPLSPLGRQGCQNASVEPGGDAGVGEVVRATGEARRELLLRQGLHPGLRSGRPSLRPPCAGRHAAHGDGEMVEASVASTILSKSDRSPLQSCNGAHKLRTVMREAVVGIDVGGTRIKAALVTPTGDVLAETVRPTTAGVGPRLGEVSVHAVGELTGAVADAVDVLAVGVAVPGLVDESAGIGVWSANLGWRDLDLRGTIAAHVDVPVAIGHDVRSGLLAEHRLGAAREADNVLFVPLGTGLASAILCRGKLVTGGLWTGEIGHVIVVPDGPLCGCGQRGCLEALSSAGAIGRRWSQETGIVGDAQEVARRADAGEEVARRVWQEAIETLAIMVAPVVAAAGTELVLIGGGLVHAGDTLLDPLRAELTARLGRDDVAVEAAALGDRSGSLGAATIALDLIGR